LSNNHPGNKHYNEFLEQRAWEYLHLNTRKAKTEFAWEVVRQLKQEGSRFLRKEKDVYVEATDEEARKKVSQRLRDLALGARDQMSRDDAEEGPPLVKLNMGQMIEMPAMEREHHVRADPPGNLHGSMQIFVKTLDGKTSIIDIKATDTVHALKTKIQAKEGIPLYRQSLRFGGKELSDGFTMSDYMIQQDAIIGLSLW
jgi:Ubiquitin family